MCLSIFGSSAVAEQSNTENTGTKYEIKLTDPNQIPEPHAPVPQAPKVIETLKKLIRAYKTKDLAAYGELLDKSCTIYDEKSKKMIVGKKAVLSYLDAKFKSRKNELVSFNIDRPIVKVVGKMAIVTYKAVQTFKRPDSKAKTDFKAEALVTSVFTRGSGSWKVLHERGDWQAAR